MLMGCTTVVADGVGNIAAVVARIQTVAHMTDDGLELQHVFDLGRRVVHIGQLRVLTRQRGPAPLVIVVFVRAACSAL